MESKQIHLLTYKMGLMVFLLAPLSAFSTSTGAMGQEIKDANIAGDNVTTASVLLTIPNGASVQGNPSYEPSPLSVELGETIAVENKDIAPHTVTNGKDATDPNMGKFFDTSIINAGDSGEILTSDLKPGEYPFFCAVHPYMAGILDVQVGSQASTEDPMDEQEPITGEEQPVKADPALIKELLDDAIENLRNGNNERAIVYMDFVRQQLSLQTTNLTMPQSTEVLVGDAIDSLQRGDIDSATLYLDQANDQLALLTGYNQTSISEDITRSDGTPRNITGTENTANLVDYHNPKFGFKISHPSNWEIREFNREHTNLIVQFLGPDITIGDNITNPIRWDITLLDEEYGDKPSKDIDELFDARLQMYGGLAGGGDVLDSQISTHGGYPFYTISTDVGTSIITEYVIMANNLTYLLSWEISDSLDYNEFLPIAQKMIDSFEITNTTVIPSDDATISGNGTVTENLTGFEMQVTNTTGNITYTPSGAIFLGSFYQDGDRYVDFDSPSTTCIDNNSNLVCDVLESNPPLSCRYDRACSSLPGQSRGFTNGSSGSVVQQTNNSNFYPPITSQQNRINWLELCMNPLVDYLITEPCSTLTSPDGFTLTPEGERVLRCLAGGALVGLLAPEALTQIRELGPAVNCGG